MRRRSYGQFCPVALAAEVFAERWTPLVIRELLYGTRHFGDFRRGIPRIPPSTLAARLRHLEDAGVIDRRRVRAGWEYHLTQAGEELKEVVERLGHWGIRWTEHEIRKSHLDPEFLMWAMHRHITVDALPSPRVVLEYNLVDVRAARRLWWIVVDKDEVDLCLRNPGHDVDLCIAAKIASLTAVYLGQLDPVAAVRSGAVQLSGAPSLMRSFSRWCPRSAFADVERPRARASL